MKEFSLQNLGYFIFCMLVLVGCQTTQSGGMISSREDLKDLGKVAGSITGKAVSEEDLINLNKQLKEDPEARSAVEAIQGSLTGQMVIKYCPIDGERYASTMTDCPVHHIELLELTD